MDKALWDRNLLDFPISDTKSLYDKNLWNQNQKFIKSKNLYDKNLLDKSSAITRHLTFKEYYFGHAT